MKTKRTTPPVRDSISITGSDGTESNYDLHEQIIAGVEDTANRKQSAITMMQQGMPQAHVEKMFGVKFSHDENLPGGPEILENRKRLIVKLTSEGASQEVIDRIFGPPETW